MERELDQELECLGSNLPSFRCLWIHLTLDPQVLHL